MEEKSPITGIILGIVVIAVILIVGWLGYTQGWFRGKQQDQGAQGGLQINVGGSTSPAPAPAPSPSGY